MQDSTVKITVTGSSAEGGIVTTRAVGKLYTRSGKRYMLYDLPDENDPRLTVKHMIIFSSRHMEITKSAPGLRTRILYEPGASTETDYSTPYGNLTLTFSTKSIVLDESDDRLMLERYRMAREEVEDKERQLEEELAELDEIKEDLNAQKEELDALIAE